MNLLLLNWCVVIVAFEAIWSLLDTFRYANFQAPICTTVAHNWSLAYAMLSLVHDAHTPGTRQICCIAHVHMYSSASLSLHSRGSTTLASAREKSGSFYYFDHTADTFSGSEMI